ncbi:putative 5-dehydro-4-deoxyglucarate dehydratase [Frankliniella fusca]|uniref:5-dehydro-4-deoxyglucarate dehydratase n=1 Tax=Frankliniella fusca TaxID=407009 RepID=A0AAE1I388_9NEOP|nr:putative 5-dehydro-4-deoxyglucarate dehydratase [Frankliniella fusca]
MDTTDSSSGNKQGSTEGSNAQQEMMTSGNVLKGQIFLFLDPALKQVCNAMGYSVANAIKCISKEDIDKMQGFMRSHLPKLLEKKCQESGRNLDLQAELLKFYGPWWVHSPADFEIIGGHLHTLYAIRDAVQSSTSTSSKRKTTNWMSPQPSKSLRSESAATGTPNTLGQISKDSAAILKVKKDLEDMLNRWLSKNVGDLEVDGDDPDEQQPVTVAANVSQDSSGTFTEKVHILEPLKKQKKGQLTVTNMFHSIEKKSGKISETPAKESATTNNSTKDQQSGTLIISDSESGSGTDFH